MANAPIPGPQAAFPVEVWETNEAIEINAALPGIQPEDVDITVTNDVLTIKANHGAEAPGGQRNYHLQEITYGTYTRSFGLPVSVESDKAEANYRHGMLHLKLPKAESVKPKQIKIGVDGSNGHLLN